MTTKSANTRAALEIVKTDSFLRQCEPPSIIPAVLEASQLGLMLGNKLGHAYLAPRRDKKTNTLKCPLLIGYRGFVALAHRTGKVSSVFPAIVYRGDQFSLKLGTGRQLGHVPVLDPVKRGDWIGADAVVEFRDGLSDFEWLTRQEIEKVRQSGGLGPGPRLALAFHPERNTFSQGLPARRRISQRAIAGGV